ncbi:LCP family protein [uncultured Dubosiella sp.]|uniref:LCP family glycopolymer transferase n=1 Tax=uncultured Dubosiella sp. TaxID=1937011 RepID=UPI00261340AB|nr:LCP family protein [uncultured Dubosiella sp.]
MNKGYRIFSIILSILTAAATGFFLYQIITLNVLPAPLLICIIAVIVLIVLILLLLLLFMAKRSFSRIVVSVLTVVICAIVAFGGFNIYKTGNMIYNITTPEGKVANTISVIALKDSKIKDLRDLRDKKVGVLNTLDRVGTDKCLEEIANDNVTITQTGFDGLNAEVAALYDHSVDAVILNEARRGSVADNEQYMNFDEETKVVYQTVYYTDVAQGSAKKVTDITEQPFTVLISGSDSRNGFAEAGRSDVNMVATVNPKTHTVLLTSVPRDYYVTTQCDEGYGCAQGQLDKLTHTGLHGVETTKKTIENLLGIEINYTLRVNFNSVVNLVNALGGIDVFVPEGYAVPSFWTNPDYGVTEGENHLDGEGALAFARERYAYTEGDFQRVKNQQTVLMAIAQKAMSPSVIVNYSRLMDALGGALETDLSDDEIQKLIQNQIDNGGSWNFITTTLDGTGSTEFCAELGDSAYVTIPNEESVQAARNQIQEVLEGKPVTEGATEAQQDQPAEQPQEEAPAAEDQMVVEEPAVQEDIYYGEDQTYYDPNAVDPGYGY